MYRIECKKEGASRIRHQGPEYFLSKSKSYNRRLSHLDQQFQDEMVEFAAAVAPYFKNKNIQIRSERHHFNLFCNDLTLVEEINRKLSKWIKSISGPTTQEEINFLQENGNKKVLCKSLPHKTYQYKVFLNFGKMSYENKKNFWEWSSNYGYRIRFNPLTQKWLKNECPWSGTNPYVYVQDQKTLSILSLYLGPKIKKIQEYVSPDVEFIDINT